MVQRHLNKSFSSIVYIFTTNIMHKTLFRCAVLLYMSSGLESLSVVKHHLVVHELLFTCNTTAFIERFLFCTCAVKLHPDYVIRILVIQASLSYSVPAVVHVENGLSWCLSIHGI